MFPFVPVTIITWSLTFASEHRNLCTQQSVHIQKTACLPCTFSRSAWIYKSANSTVSSVSSLSFIILKFMCVPTLALPHVPKWASSRSLRNLPNSPSPTRFCQLLQKPATLSTLDVPASKRYDCCIFFSLPCIAAQPIWIRPGVFVIAFPPNHPISWRSSSWEGHPAVQVFSICWRNRASLLLASNLPKNYLRSLFFTVTTSLCANTSKPAPLDTVWTLLRGLPDR